MEHLDPEDLAYLAGIIDGEGCIGLARRKDPSLGYATPTLQITNTDDRLIDWLSELGGNTYVQPSRPRRKPCRLWTTAGAEAREIIRAVRPWLRLKGEQADLVLNFPRETERRARRGDGQVMDMLTADCLVRRREAISQMRELNRRGVEEID